MTRELLQYTVVRVVMTWDVTILIDTVMRSDSTTSVLPSRSRQLPKSTTVLPDTSPSRGTDAWRVAAICPDSTSMAGIDVADISNAIEENRENATSGGSDLVAGANGGEGGDAGKILAAHYCLESPFTWEERPIAERITVMLTPEP